MNMPLACTAAWEKLIRIDVGAVTGIESIPVQAERVGLFNSR